VVEVVGDEELGDVVELTRVHEDAADDGLLGLDGVGRRRARALLRCGERHGPLDGSSLLLRSNP
jgi:hypothetical protein